MRPLIHLAMLSMAVLAPRNVLCQDAPEPATSLSLRPFGQMTVGVWHRFTPRVELGLELGAAVVEREGEEGGRDESARSASVEAAAKLFGAPRGSLRPYGIGSLSFVAHRIELDDDVQLSSGSLGASLGLGLEWSPGERIRIGGHAGVRAAILDGERTRFEFDNPIAYDVTGWEASTFTTGLTFYYSF